MRPATSLRLTSAAAVGLMLLATACTAGGGQGAKSGPGFELVKAKCTMCHTIDRISSASKDRAGWEQTVTRMRSKGAVVTDTEAGQIVDYLSQSGAK